MCRVICSSYKSSADGHVSFVPALFGSLLPVSPDCAAEAEEAHNCADRLARI